MVDASGVSSLALFAVNLPDDLTTNVQMLLRWVHFLAGITWIGILYFFNLVNVPFLKALDAPTRGKVVPQLMPRALWWFRWGAVVTVLAGLVYFIHQVHIDAANAPAGTPSGWGGWLLSWFLIVAVAYVIIYFLLRPVSGVLNKGWVLAVLIGLVVLVMAWVFLRTHTNEWASNKVLSIGVGGGIGIFMLLNVWGIIWPAQKRIIAWSAENAEKGTPIPPESATLARRAFLASRTNAWLSIPMLFFMAAASHYPFLGR
jgi:uncharacterized membrane protein